MKIAQHIWVLAALPAAVVRFTPVYQVLSRDVMRLWGKQGRMPITLFLNRFMRVKSFRNIVYYRLGSHSMALKILAGLLGLVYRPYNHLLIICKDIGPGLFIQHGFSTIIAAKHIGKNFWVNQNVTIGHNGPGLEPFIGDDVMVRTGAVVVGDICIGDNVIIGANAVVTKDVPSNTTVAGVPAKVIKNSGTREFFNAMKNSRLGIPANQSKDATKE